ncbi:amino acid ABC transporter substrate-binding protein, partial [Pseudomonas aeruginosa]
MTSCAMGVNKDAAFPFTCLDEQIGHKGSVLAGCILDEEYDRFTKATLDLKPVPSMTQCLHDLMLKRSKSRPYR